MTKMRLLLCAHLLIVAASQAAAQGHKTPATELDAQQSSVYIFNGGDTDGITTGLANGWRTLGLGADINTSDAKNARPGSSTSLSAIVEPFIEPDQKGRLVLATSTPFNAFSEGGMVLDIWLYGSVLIRGALKIKNLKSERESLSLTLANLAAADPATNTSRLLGPADDGWYRLQINLASLVENALKLPSDSATVPTPDVWDAIVFEDVSKQGFDIFIDQMRLVPSATDAPGARAEGNPVDGCVGSACNPILTAASVTSDLVPLYGGDIIAQDANAPSPVIARLRPGVSKGEILALCAELTGAEGRFDGSCTLQPLFNNTGEINGEVKAQEELEAPVEWPFLAITASTEADVRAMRSALQDVVDYFDRDKEVTTFYSNRKLAGSLTEVLRERGLKEAKAMLAEEEEKETLESNVAVEEEPVGGEAADNVAAAIMLLPTVLLESEELSQEIDQTAPTLLQEDSSTSNSAPSSPAIELAEEFSEPPTVEIKSRDAAVYAYCSGTPWNLDRIDQSSLPLNNRYSPSNTGAGVHIYVLDTGTRTSHEAFSGRVGTGADCTIGACSSTPATPDDNGHGTHVAGTAVGTCYGVAQDAILHTVKVLGANGGGSFSGIIEGLRWVSQHVAANGGWPAVASLSLGGDRSKSIDDAVEAVVSAGIPVVVAAGNDFGADSCTRSPAGAPSAITVAATDINDNAATFTNIGPCVDIWAPGATITSASSTGDSNTRELSGTSMATPAVAGALALLLQTNPNASPSQLRNLLLGSSVKAEFVSGTTDNFLRVR